MKAGIHTIQQVGHHNAVVVIEDVGTVTSTGANVLLVLSDKDGWGVGFNNCDTLERAREIVEAWVRELFENEAIKRAQKDEDKDKD